MDVQNQQGDSSVLDLYGRDLTKLAREQKLDPVIGRATEVDRCLHILGRRNKNNPVLIGRPGVGKTAIVEDLANRIAQKDVPINLQNAQIIALDIAAIVAGAKYRGAFEERMKQIINEVQSRPRTIIFIDEIHLLVGAGKVEGGMDAANMLKPMLARGEFSCIGATTDDEYREYIEKDKALERRFSVVLVEQPTPEDAIAMIHGLRSRYELHHGLKISNSAIDTAVSLAVRYVNDRFLPDSAIDLIDEAASSEQASLSSKPPELRQLEHQVSLKTMQAEACKDADAQQALQAELAELSAQSTCVREAWDAKRAGALALHSKKQQLEQYKLDEVKAINEGDLSKAGQLKYDTIPKLEKEIKYLETSGMCSDSLEPEHIAKVVSIATHIPVNKLVASDKERLINMEAELSQRIVGQSHAVAAVANAVRRTRVGLGNADCPMGCFLFVGPTGVGKTELCKELTSIMFGRADYMTRIDMSEFNQEHNVARLIGAPPGYIGYERGGILTESVRRQPYQVILCDEIEKAHPNVYNIFLQVMDPGRLTDGSGRVVSFKNVIFIMTSNLGADNDFSAIHQPEDIRNAVKDHFPPEFINRLDEVVIFESLSIDQIKQIVPRHITQLEKSLSKEYNIKIDVTERALEWLAQNGYSQLYGARPLKNLFERSVVDPLCLKLLQEELVSGDTVIIDRQENELVLRCRRLLNR